MTIQEEIQSIESVLEVEVSDNPNELKERIAQVAVFHSRLSKMLVDTKKILRQKKVSEIAQKVTEIAKQNFLSAKAQNAIIDCICIEEQYLVDKIERLQASCKHDLDASRSILSYVKEEMRNNIQQ